MEPETINTNDQILDTPYTFNPNDPELDAYELIDKIFDYLLKLDGPTPTDDEIKEKKKEERVCFNKPKMCKIITIDDSNKSTYNKLYFNGKCDSNQTRYEFLSNNCKISTVAKTDKVGKALHTFLRQVIDNHPEDFFLYVCGMEEKESFTISEIVDLMERSNYNYSHTSHTCDTRLGLYYDKKLDGYDYDGKWSEYKREINIHRFLPDVDVWNIYRIASAIGIWGPEEQYKDIKM